MTVAAVILCASAETALRDVLGVAAVRRIVSAAWAGGAVPVVVVAPDPDGEVARALAGTSAILAEPVPEGGRGPQIVRGMDVAANAVTETEAALVWPVGMVWVGPETVTSLIEGHGPDRHSILRPAFDGQPGWPVLIPMDQLEAVRGVDADLEPDAILEAVAAGGPELRTLDLGDPGVIHGASVAAGELPPYVGPVGPMGGRPPDWGSAAADLPEEGPLEGPTLAPYGQVADADRV